jgi:hypothetical protein
MKTSLRLAAWFVLLASAPAFAAPVFGVRTDLPAPINPLGVVVVDLNGDSAPDLVATSPATPPTQGLLSTWFGRGDGYFWSGPSSLCARAPGHLTAGRFDVDAYSDVAITGTYVSLESDILIQVLRGQGDGSFTESALLRPSPSADRFGGLVIADFDDDGKADLAAAHSGGEDGTPLQRPLWLYSGRGDATFDAPRYLGEDRVRALDVDSADLNGDGTLDLALCTDFAITAFLLQLPDEEWVQGTGSPMQGMNRVALGQLDGDGLPDAVYTQQTGSKLTIRLTTAPGTLLSIQLAGIPQGLVIRDLDGDGHDDLILPLDLPGRVQFRAGHSDGTFDAPVDYAVGARPYDVAVADVNADGLLDLVTTNNGAASVTVLLQGNPVIGSVPAPPRFVLHAPFPNPTFGAVRLGFELASDEPCAVTVHDVRGRLVESRAIAHFAPGPQSIRVFEANRPPAGIYWATLRQGPRVASQRFVVLP